MYTMSKKFFGFAAAVACLTAVNATAATVSFSSSVGPASAAAVAAGVPEGTLVNVYTVTTDADILSVNQVVATLSGGSLFQVAPPFGSDNEAPDPAFITLNRALEADSWITTPGATSKLGGGSGFPGDGTGTWGDLTNDGPQTNFKFATLSLASNFNGMFIGRVSVAGTAGPEVFPFSLPINIPEPGTIGLTSLGLLALGVVRRRAA
jgi:hypothetical protein